MVSKYFEAKTGSESFKIKTAELLESLKGKKVIIYGAGEGFFALDKIYNFRKNLNIIAIADKKFETSAKDITGLKQIAPASISSEDFDIILITNEQPRRVFNYILNTLEIPEEKVLRLFKEEIREEALSYNYLCEHNFSKTLPKLIKKLKGKKVVLYGAGVFLEAILKFYDLSGLDIVGVVDKKYGVLTDGTDETFHGYKVYGVKSIKDLNPDYVLVSTKFYVSIIEDLYYKVLKNSKIKIKPLVKKSFFTLLKEIWV